MELETGRGPYALSQTELSTNAIGELLRDGRIRSGLSKLRSLHWTHPSIIARSVPCLLELEVVRQEAGGDLHPTNQVEALERVLDRMLDGIRKTEEKQPPDFGRSRFFAGALLLRRAHLLEPELPNASDLSVADLSVIRDRISQKWRVLRGDRKGEPLADGSFRANHESGLFDELSFELAAMEAIASASPQAEEPTRHQHRESAAPLVVSTIPAVTPLLGRTAEQEELRELLLAGERTILIHGPGGLGKSALAKAMANDVIADRDRFPDLSTFLWISAKAKDSVEVRDTRWLIDKLYRALGFMVPTADDQCDLDVTGVLARAPTLLVIDNFEDIQEEETIDWLLGLPGCTRVVLTSRLALDSTLPLVSYPLRDLDDDIAIQLLDRECGRMRLQGVPREEAMRIIEVTGGSPLAIRWTVGLLAEGYPTERVIALLKKGAGDLFRSIFADHWSSLSDEAKDTLCSASLMGETFSRPLLDAIVDAPEDVSDLLRRSLIEPWDEAGESRRFTLHPLVRTFTRRHVMTSESRKGGLARACAIALIGYFDERRLLQHGRDAYLSLDHDIASVLKVHRHLASAIDDADTAMAGEVVDLFEAVSVPLWTLGYWDARVDFACKAAAAAEREERWGAAARAAGTAAIVRFWQGRTGEAKSLSSRSLKVAENSDERIDRAVGLRVKALLAAGQGDVDDGVAKLATVLDILGERIDSAPEKVRFFADWPCRGPRGHEAGRVALHQETGIMLIGAKRYEEGLAPLEASEELAIEIGDDEGRAISLSHIGRCFQGLEQLPDAHRHFTDGLELAEGVGRRSTIGRCLLGLAQIAESNKDADEARRRALTATDVFSRLGMRSEQRAAEEIAG